MQLTLELFPLVQTLADPLPGTASSFAVSSMRFWKGQRFLLVPYLFPHRCSLVCGSCQAELSFFEDLWRSAGWTLTPWKTSKRRTRTPDLVELAPRTRRASVRRRSSLKTFGQNLSTRRDGLRRKRASLLTIAAEELLGLAERSLALMTTSWRGGQGGG